MRRSILVLWIAGMAIIASGAATTASAVQIPRSVIGNGAAPADGMSAPGVRIVGTAGQAAVGLSTTPGLRLHHGYWSTAGVSIVGVEDDPGVGSSLPRELSFSAPMPNPARGPVTFELALPRDARVRFAVYDVQGRKVDALESAAMAAGRHRLRWDATRAGSRAGGAGVYFARLDVDGKTVGTRRVVIVQ
jgi:hypothetical protein